jgi:hypothetical protein
MSTFYNITRELITLVKTLPKYTVMDPERLLSNLKVRLGDLQIRKKKLNQIILPPKISVGLLVGAVVEYFAWLAYDNKNSGLAWFVGFYGLLLGVGGALALVEVIAEWFGFPNKEYEALEPHISRLEQDIRKVGRYISAIDEIRQLQPAASPSQNVTLNGHIETLKKATEESFIQSYDSSAYEYMRRSVGAIRGHIKRSSEPETKAPANQPSASQVTAPKLPIKEVPIPPNVTPVQPTKTKDEFISSVPSIPPKANPETPPVVRQPTELPKATPAILPPKPFVSTPSATPKKPEKIYAEGPVPASTELDISTVFSPRPPSIIKKIARIGGKRLTIKSMVNYLELYVRNQDVGKLGELFILKTEREYLLKHNRKDLADRVVHVSVENDSAGYDILTFDITGAKKYIEVKTSTAGYESQFFLSVNETQMMTILPNYFIYRIYNFDWKNKGGLIYKIDCAKDFEKYFRLETAIYKVIPNIG